MNYLLVGTLMVVVLVVGVTSNTGESCSDGEVKQIDCNRCKCIKGVFSCTKRHCLTRNKRQEPTDGCTPGETKKLDCNTCSCTSTGNWACTLKGCLRPKREETCTDGEVKQIDCNRCKCSNGVFACTRRHCLTKTKRQQPSDGCTPGESKKIDCNNCHCGQDGNWACTYKLCIRQKREETCTDGEVKQIDCNRCKCINGVFSCTKKHCVPRVKRRVSSGECTPREYKKLDCNRCRCTENGNWLCTLRACLRKKREETCTPGESKKEDCNTCHCIVGNKWACTRRHCLKRSVRDVSGCNPGDSYKACSTSS